MIASSTREGRLREAAKKVPPLVVRRLSGGGWGVKARPLRKNNFFDALKKKEEKKFR